MGMNSTITTQTNIRQVTKTYDDVDLFSGMLKLDDANIGQYDPMVSGYATFFWTKLPPFMMIGNRPLIDRFKNLTEKGHTSFDGIQDMQVTTDDMVGGIAGNSFKMATNMKDEFDTFQMKVYELQGSPIRESVEYWLTGIRDPKTGYATYHGLVDSIDGGYCARNHTGELLYVVTDPSGSTKGIEYACLVTNIMPTKVPRQHLNLQHGDHNLVTFDLEFTGEKYESAAISKIAKEIFDKRRRVERYIDFVPKNLKA